MWRMDRRLFVSAALAAGVSATGALGQTGARFAAAARFSAERGGVSFIVVRHGIVLAEDYPGGAPHARWPIYAGTRCFAPLLAASLVEDELMSLDEPVAMTLGGWGAHPIKSTITIRALLTGASGVAFGRRAARDLAALIDAEPVEAPGVRFSDDAAPYLLLAEIARRKLEAAGRESDPARYLTARTLLSIGCVPIAWTRGPGGAPRFDDGAAVSARGWAQAGELIRREGVWRAQQLADENVLREALRGSVAEARAGFGLWLAPQHRSRDALSLDSDLWRAPTPAPSDLAMAAGDGGQRLYLSPSQGIVIARQARGGANPSWSDAQFLSLLWRDV